MYIYIYVFMGASNCYEKRDHYCETALKRIITDPMTRTMKSLVKISVQARSARIITDEIRQRQRSPAKVFAGWLQLVDGSRERAIAARNVGARMVPRTDLRSAIRIGI